jgi:hypothetical protein
MKFGIFIFGDNHPELQRSNQAFFAEFLRSANGPRSLAFAFFWFGEHHFHWYETSLHGLC